MGRRLSYLTGGESHGRALVTIIDGMPCGVPLSNDFIDKQMARRKLGYGRGGRMKIEKDDVQILSGVRFARTIGSPVTIQIENKDWKNWQELMAAGEVPERVQPVTTPRPGHADLAGVMKTGQHDIRNILERASARETAARVAAGAVARALLEEFNIQVISHVTAIGSVKAETEQPKPDDLEAIDASPVRCFNEKAARGMVKTIDEAKVQGDTLGGIFEVLVYGCPPGLGSYASWEGKLDGRLARAVMTIQAIKGVEIGEGFELASKSGSAAHDEITYDKDKGFFRKTNRAGGLEGGLTNGEPVVIRAAMKPIPTLGKPLQTVDIASKARAAALKERADVCAVPAAAVVAEAVVSLEIADALLEKFGGDSIADVRMAYDSYLERVRNL